MAQHGQQQQETSAADSPSVCGGRQAVVEVCEITSCGLVFWSRYLFEVGAEVQVRIKRSALTPAMLAMTATQSPWVMLKCLVVAGAPQRRADGSSGFKVSLLVVQAAGDSTRERKLRSEGCWCVPPLGGLRRFGLN
jgi:hypothetical protein